MECGYQADTATYLLLLWVRVVEDDGHVALPPQIIEDSVVLHAEGQRFMWFAIQVSERQGGRGWGRRDIWSDRLVALVWKPWVRDKPSGFTHVTLHIAKELWVHSLPLCRIKREGELNWLGTHSWHIPVVRRQFQDDCDIDFVSPSPAPISWSRKPWGPSPSRIPCRTPGQLSIHEI